MNTLAGIFDRFSDRIPNFEMPFNKYYTYWPMIEGYLIQANSIFPVDAILSMLIILGTLRGVLLVIWTIKFVRQLLPF